MSIDVVTLGETMVRFTPPEFDLIEQSRSMELFIGGSESNTAVGLARLGCSVAWLSRLTRNPLGQLIANTIRGHGVDVSQLTWTDRDRVGTFFMERGKPPRSSRVFYDRAESAFAQMTPADLPEKLFVPSASKVFHTTGITVGVSDSASATAARALELAQRAGWQTSFDVNYRSGLWTPAQARAGCERFMNESDWVFVPMRDARLILDVDSTEPEEVLEFLGRRFPRPTLIMTLGASGAAVRTPDGAFLAQSAFETTEVERLGGGDAFSAGFLAAVLQGESIASALRWACAAAAVKYTIPGDLPLLDPGLVQRLVDGDHASGIHR